MDTQLLEKILDCPTLPSLPAIAVQVIELTNDPNVCMDELAALIQTDQALSARILRTVNSSFYGLRERCTTIRKALVLLGLSPVKSLALGFSLVSSLDQNKEPSFDYSAYWRRGLFTAVAAKLIAEKAKLDDADECFISGLLQDIGMIAMLQTLKEEYCDLIQGIGGDHRALAQAEIRAYDIQHADIGATLANRWKLPEPLTVPIKYHERPTAAPEDHVQLAKAVALGNIAHDVVSEEDATPFLRTFYKRCNQWFRLDEDAADEILRSFGDATSELSDLFSLDTGDNVDTDALLAQAEQNLIRIAEEQPKTPSRTDRLHGLLQGDDDNDPLTGLPNAAGFEKVLSAMFEAASDSATPLSLVQVVLDGLKDVSGKGGLLASDAILIRAIAFLQQNFEPMGGIVCRAGAGIISIVLPDTRENQVSAAVNQFQSQFNASLPTLLEPIGVSAAVVSASIGLASAAPASDENFNNPKGFVTAATKAAIEARKAGGNCVKTFEIKDAA